jgi:hypothetical protein
VLVYATHILLYSIWLLNFKRISKYIGNPIALKILRKYNNTKPRIIHNVESTQDVSTPWAQIEEVINDLAKNQTFMMNKITNLERSHKQAPKPAFRGQPQNPS